MAGNALVVDDDNLLTRSYSDIVENQGFTVSFSHTLNDARNQMKKLAPDLVLLDLRLPDGNGIELLESSDRVHRSHFVVITGHADIDTAIRATKSGAKGYLEKPVDYHKLIALLKNIKNTIVDKSYTYEKLKNLDPDSFVSGAKCMEILYKSIFKVSTSNASVFIQGESGTGKEVVAETIHKLSGRTGKFVPVNCGSITSELIASELFGHVKGSFTGALRDHEGLFAQAKAGTLFLDEITEMPLNDQTHLLRALESRKIKPVGATNQRDIDVRIIAATNRDLEEAVVKGHLREDLYYRLAEFVLVVPPLRNRFDDVEELTNYFLSKLNNEYGTHKSISKECVSIFEDYKWPGNIREFKNVLLHAFINSENSIDTDSLALHNIRYGATNDSVKNLVGRKIVDVEKELILETLDSCKGNKRIAADILGLSLKTLYNKLNQFDKS